MEALPLKEVHVISKDGRHFQVIVVSEMFDKLSRIEKQKAVYTPLKKYILDNRIHAVSIKTYTPAEWERDRKFNNL